MYMYRNAWYVVSTYPHLIRRHQNEICLLLLQLGVPSSIIVVPYTLFAFSAIGSVYTSVKSPTQRKHSATVCASYPWPQARLVVQRCMLHHRSATYVYQAPRLKTYKLRPNTNTEIVLFLKVPSERRSHNQGIQRTPSRTKGGVPATLSQRAPSCTKKTIETDNPVKAPSTNGLADKPLAAIQGRLISWD